MTGWNIFPMMAAVVVLLSTVGAFFALRSRERSPWAMGFAILSIAVMALFIGLLWHTLERPPLRTMGETRLWYSFFILVAGLATYARWRYRWIMLFSTILATVFIIINIANINGA